MDLAQPFIWGFGKMTVRHTYLVELPNDHEYRICRYCSEEKPMREFKAHKKCKGGRTQKCKKCTLKDEMKMRERLKNKASV